MLGYAKVLGLLALVVTLPSVGGADRQGSATAIPISRELLSFTATSESGEESNFKVLNGGMATLSVPDGPKLGLVPVLDGDKVALTLVAITPVGTEPGNESATVTGKIALEFAQPVPVPGAPKPLTITWDGTSPATPAAADPPNQTQGKCSRCCVYCGDQLICACQVITECGSCCCVDCGGCDLRSSPHPATRAAAAAAPRARQ